MKMTLPYKNPVSVAGHRGYPDRIAENTRESFAAAADCGVDMIETDIHLTKDNVLVLMHDDKVDRTTDSVGRIADFTYEELRNVNCNPHGAFSEITTLEEFLRFAVERDVMVNLEIKEYLVPGNEDRCRRCVWETLKLVEKYDWIPKTIINSFDAYVLDYADRISGGKFLLHGFYPYSIMRNVERNPDEYLYCACIFDDRNADNYRYLIERGIEPWAGAGVREPEHFETCVKLGAKLFTSNDPGRAMEILRAIGKHD
ncbi:MAG: hypothetical protein IJ449_02885 [Clostridia bacterium]|nr:hypothetical protein [Clostridia bacterium]